MSFKVNVYDPTAQAYAPRIRHEDWETHRTIISQLHARKTPRKVMLKRLRDDYHFTPTLGQLQAKCKEWNLKVYAKDGVCIKSPAPEAHPSHGAGRKVPKPSSPSAFHLATESGFVEEWSDDYRVHPSAPSTYQNQDHSLPPEYIGGGLLANSADSHWPIPDDDRQCQAMLQAAHFYFSCAFYQQAFSIYRAAYLYQRRHHPICDSRLTTTILQCACSAVTEHQRNIMHSVLTEVGSSSEVDNLSPLLLGCLQSASLSMVSSDISCDVDKEDLTKARATAYLQIFNLSTSGSSELTNNADIQALLYTFEHNLLMQEHSTKILQNLLSWCETSIDKMQREVDDIFVGHSSCEDEYHRRVAQVLSGYLLSQWHKVSDDHDDQYTSLMRPYDNSLCSFQFRSTTTQTLVALAFVIVDAVRYDPVLTHVNTSTDQQVKTWFSDAAKLFKRGIRMLSRLDDRNRCAVFAEAYLERFYISVSYKLRACEWTAQLPAIIDSVGMSLAHGVRENSFWTEPEAQDPDYGSIHVEQAAGLDSKHIDADLSITQHMYISHAPDNGQALPVSIPITIPLADAPSPTSDDRNSIASFINTYHRTLKQKFASSVTKSGRSTPGDLMSLTSSAEFKFGLVTSTGAGCGASVNASADVDSFWQIIVQ